MGSDGCCRRGSTHECFGESGSQGHSFPRSLHRRYDWRDRMSPSTLPVQRRTRHNQTEVRAPVLCAPAFQTLLGSSCASDDLCSLDACWHDPGHSSQAGSKGRKRPHGFLRPCRNAFNAETRPRPVHRIARTTGSWFASAVLGVFACGGSCKTSSVPRGLIPIYTEVETAF